VADVDGPEKKRRNSRGHGNSVGTRYRGRPHQRFEVDPPAAEDRRTTRAADVPVSVNTLARGVDAKKRELVGNFKNADAKSDRSPVLVQAFPGTAAHANSSFSPTPVAVIVVDAMPGRPNSKRNSRIPSISP
jgi:hypothetical protein